MEDLDEDEGAEISARRWRRRKICVRIYIYIEREGHPSNLDIFRGKETIDSTSAFGGKRPGGCWDEGI